MSDSLKNLAVELQDFAARRQWSGFHTPKNLAMSLMIEAGELAEHFQWLIDEQGLPQETKDREAVADEIADVLIYLVLLADKLDIDPIAAARKKIKLNEKRYPEDQCNGTIPRPRKVPASF